MIRRMVGAAHRTDEGDTTMTGDGRRYAPLLQGAGLDRLVLLETVTPVDPTVDPGPVWDHGRDCDCPPCLDLTMAEDEKPDGWNGP
jgi:hypothetical protein